MEAQYWRQCETTGDTGENARTQFMELCYWKQRETTADNEKSLDNGRQRETMRQHNLYSYVIGINGKQRETTGDNARTQFIKCVIGNNRIQQQTTGNH